MVLQSVNLRQQLPKGKELTDFTVWPCSTRQGDFQAEHAGRRCIYYVYVKGALYRIWCGVNILGDSGVKVV